MSIEDQLEKYLNEGKVRSSDYISYIIARKRAFLGKPNKIPQLLVLTAAEQAINGAALSDDEVFKKMVLQRAKALVAISK